MGVDQGHQGQGSAPYDMASIGLKVYLNGISYQKKRYNRLQASCHRVFKTILYSSNQKLPLDEAISIRFSTIPLASSSQSSSHHRDRSPQIAGNKFILAKPVHQSLGIGRLLQRPSLILQKLVEESRAFVERVGGLVVQQFAIANENLWTPRQMKLKNVDTRHMAHLRLVQLNEVEDLSSALQVEAAATLLRGMLENEPENAAYAALLSKQLSDQAFMDGMTTSKSRAVCNEAMDIADQAIQFDPSHLPAHVASCVARGRLALFTPSIRQKVTLATQALYACRDAMNIDPTNDFALHLQGKWHFEMAGLNGLVRVAANTLLGGDLAPGSYAEALVCFQRATEQCPQRLVHRVELAKVLDKVGRKEEAKQQLEIAQVCPVEDINAHLQLQEAKKLLADLSHQTQSSLWNSAQLLQGN